MTLPTYKIEIAFNAGVTTPAASRTWTDVTAYVMLADGIEITYGRGDWRSEADANTLRLTLNNSDGRFTAGRADSPYYPNVKLGRPIRVTATVADEASVRFVGFIDEWPLEWPQSVSGYATAQVTASSRLAWLGNGTELRSIVEEEVFLDKPALYFTMGEPAGSTAANDTAGCAASPATLKVASGTATFGTEIGPGTDSLTGVTLPANASMSTGVVKFQNPNFFTGPDGSLEAWFTSTKKPSGDATILAVWGSMQWMELLITSAGVAKCRFPDQFGSDFILTDPTAKDLTDGNIHHVAASNNNGTAFLYVDGVQVANATFSGTPRALTQVGAGVTIYTDLSWTATGRASWAHSLFHLAAYASGLSSFGQHYRSGADGFAGELSGLRIARYASFAGVASSEISRDLGQVPGLAHLDTTGNTAIDMMRKVEATEEGILFDRADGNLAFHDRAHRYSAASAFVLDVAANQVAPGLQPRLDRVTVRNDVTATSTDGTITSRVTNAASIDSYGEARESLDLATTNAEEPYHHASWLVAQYAEPQPRVPQLSVNLNNLSDALTQSILAAAVSTQFTVNNMPSQAATPSQDYIVEGYSESIGASRHSITFNVSQAQPYDVWTVEDPVFGQFDAYPIAL